MLGLTFIGYITTSWILDRGFGLAFMIIKVRVIYFYPFATGGLTHLSLKMFLAAYIFLKREKNRGCSGSISHLWNQESRTVKKPGRWDFFVEDRPQ